MCSGTPWGHQLQGVDDRRSESDPTRQLPNTHDGAKDSLFNRDCLRK